MLSPVLNLRYPALHFTFPALDCPFLALSLGPTALNYVSPALDISNVYSGRVFICRTGIDILSAGLLFSTGC